MTMNLLISLLKVINCAQDRNSRRDSGKMVDNSDSVREFFKNEFFEVIPAIRKKNKRPDNKDIFSYIARKSATNIVESFIDKMLNGLLVEKVIVNNTTSCGDSFFVIENCFAEKDLREHTIKPIDIKQHRSRK